LINYLCIIQARLNSSRLPSKVMLDLGGETLLERCFKSVLKSQKIDKIVVATSNKTQDDIIEDKLKLLNIECYRGDLENVLERFYFTALKYKAKNIIRVTADNPLMDGYIIDKLIDIYKSKKDINYSRFSNAVIGLSTEVFTFQALEKAYNSTTDKYDIEHVTPYIKKNDTTYIKDIEKNYRYPNLSATIDTLDDYIKMQKFYLYCQRNNISANIENFIKYNNGEKNE